MQLLTEKIKKRLPPLRSTEDDKDKEFVCKFFDPCGSWTWYVLEGEEMPDGDWRLYGLVDGLEKEWGYFMLSELESIRDPLGLGIERDVYFRSCMQPVEKGS